MSYARLSFIAILYGLTSSSASAAQCQAFPHQLEQAILDQLNLARKDPAGYAFRLEDLRPDYKGKERRLTRRIYLKTQEGLPAVEEAIQVLQKTSPRGGLVWNPCLAESASEHVRDTGPKGLVGHDSSRGESSSQRIQRYIQHFRMIGENISYGSTTGDEVVGQLLIDDGVPDRGHRKNILEGRFNAVGISCGPHTQYGNLCVIDFAQE